MTITPTLNNSITAVASDRPNPGDDPRPTELARSLASLIAAGAVEGEQLGRLPGATAQALIDARLFNVLLPRDIGGHDGTHAELFDVIETISRADASAGWCVSIGTSNNTGMGFGLPPDGLAEIFGTDGRTVAAGALAPVATSESVPGGYMVSGKFSWASGSAHSSWYVANSLITTASGGLGLRFHVLPISACTAMDNWKVAGLKATCSQDLVLEPTFVPLHRCYEIEFGADTFAGRYAASVDDGQATDAGSATGTRRGPSVEESTVTGIAGLSAWACGVALRAIDELRTLAPVSRRLLADGMLSDDPTVRIGLVEVEGPLLALRNHVRSLLVTMDADLAESGNVTEALRVTIVEAALSLTRAAREAVLFAYDVAPSGAIYLTHPLQRCLRDLLTGLKHAAGSRAMFSKAGQARLGVAGHGL